MNLCRYGIMLSVMIKRATMKFRVKSSAVIILGLRWIAPRDDSVSLLDRRSEILEMPIPAMAAIGGTAIVK
jgi:hypothetical protein